MSNPLVPLPHSRILFIVIVFASVVSDGLCQSDSASATSENSFATTIANDGLSGLRTAGYVLLAPTRWNSDDLIIAGGIVAGTAVAYSVDNTVFRLMDRNRTHFNDDVSRVAVEYGSGYFAAGLPLAIYGTGLILRDKWIRETAMLMGTTILLTSTLTTVGKIGIGRARPYTGFGRHEFKLFNAHEDFVSFPSGHTTAAFALSAVLAARIKNPWASIGLYGVATAAAVSRLYSHDHWLSDVVFSAAYTTAVANSVVRWFEHETEVGGRSSFNIIPSGNGVGVVWLL
jgi:membrane-associated phospholipid phosphatase